jgi:hypothetical protein
MIELLEKLKLSHWIPARLKEAKLTPRESKELSDFLTRRSTDLSLDQKAEVSLQEVQDLVSWLTTLMATADISEIERKQLNDWLVILLSRNSTLAPEELQQIKLALNFPFRPAWLSALTT